MINILKTLFHNPTKDQILKEFGFPLEIDKNQIRKAIYYQSFQMIPDCISMPKNRHHIVPYFNIYFKNNQIKEYSIYLISTKLLFWVVVYPSRVGFLDKLPNDCGRQLISYSHSSICKELLIKHMHFDVNTASVDLILKESLSISIMSLYEFMDIFVRVNKKACLELSVDD
jgi:L-rhamnose mutarotase